MKWFKYLALVGFLATGGCGSDDSVSPSPDLADVWVGAYEGVGSYALSNGESGVEKPITLLIEAANPKEVTIAATLVYGSGRSDKVDVFALITPDDPDHLNAEYRGIKTRTNFRTVFSLTKEDGAVSGSIVTSTLRHSGSWTEDQRMIIKVEKQ